MSLIDSLFLSLFGGIGAIGIAIIASIIFDRIDRSGLSCYAYAIMIIGSVIAFILLNL